MSLVNKKEALVLFLGDILIFVAALWVTLLIRYLEIPSSENWGSHILPFSVLFLFWFVSFYISGLYRKHTLILKNSLPNILFNTQITNIILAVLFFYFIPYFSITPKTNLFIYLIVSFAFIYFWRIYLFNKITPIKKQKAILISGGSEAKDLEHEINNNDRYGFYFVYSVNINELSESDNEIMLETIKKDSISIVVADLNNKKIEDISPDLYDLIFKKVQFIDTYELYEYIFDRVPLSMMNYQWFVKNISTKDKPVYDFLKRLMDLVISIFLLTLSLIIYPFVMLAIWLETKGESFITQERVGKDNKVMRLFKFKSMTSNDKGKWITEGDNRVTKVGKFIRASRIDELPQLFNVVKGDISLIGPRPDIIGLFENLSQQVPYYTIRNVVKPGLSGWAQTHQEIPPHSIEETKIRLSYDLYYIKNRSLVLDFKIALQTLKTLISRTGK